MVHHTEPPAEIKELYGCQVVIDTDSSYIYIGNLEFAGPDYYVLTNLDAHDTADTKTSKEFGKPPLRLTCGLSPVNRWIAAFARSSMRCPHRAQP